MLQAVAILLVILILFLILAKLMWGIFWAILPWALGIAIVGYLGYWIWDKIKGAGPKE